MRIIPGLGWVAVTALALILFAGPLAFGGVLPGWRSSLQALAFVALAAAVLSGSRPLDAGPALRVFAVGVSIACLGLLQVAPMPMALLESLSPAAAEAWTATADVTGAPAGAGSLSVAPDLTWRSSLLWLSVSAAFLAAALLTRDVRHRLVLGGVLVGTALLQVVYGFGLWRARSTVILGMEVAGHPDRMRGTFVNADHLALFLEIALAVVMAAIFWSIRTGHRVPAAGLRGIRVAAPVAVWLTLFAGLTFTGSRAGLVALLSATAVQGVLAAGSSRQWRWLPVAALIAAAGLLVVSWSGTRSGVGRLLATTSYELEANPRPRLYEGTIELVRDHPVLGTGLGTFEVAFPAVADETLTGRVWSHAHSDWLELLATGGVVGLLLLLVGVWLVLSALVRTLAGSRATTSRATALAALGAAFAVGLHEVVDFGLTRPANAMAFAVVLGLGVGLHRSYGSSTSDSTGTSIRDSGRSSRRDGSVEISAAT